MSSTSISPSATALQAAYQSSNALLVRNLAGIAQTKAVVRPRTDMNNIIWVVGHIAYWRHQMADTLNIASAEESPDLSIFRGIERGAPKDTEGWSLDAVTALCESGFTRMCQAFATTAEGRPGADQYLTMAEQLLVHEAYTVGQVAVYRRLAGYEGAI